MPNGTIARLLIDKGFGFIRDESGVEHFFHQIAPSAAPSSNCSAKASASTSPRRIPQRAPEPRT